MFNHLIGNRTAAAAIERMMTAGRLPHSLLLAGPEGVGKLQFAIEIGRSLVCTSEEKPCGRCAACRRAGEVPIPKPDKKEDFKRVIFSEHPDVGMVAPYNRNILVDAIRNLEAEANFRPFEAQARVFIINDADRMNDSASNALLKTLEEPPESTYIILVTALPDRLLTTIRSRCQIVRFAPVGRDEIVAYLVKDGRVSVEDAELAASVSKGSIGRAISLDIEAYKASRELMLEVLGGALSRRNFGGMLQISEQLADARNKDRFEESLEILENLVRDLFVLRSGSTHIVNRDIDKVLARLAAGAEISRLSDWLREIETLGGNLKVNVNRRAAVDGLIMRMSA